MRLFFVLLSWWTTFCFYSTDLRSRKQILHLLYKTVTGLPSGPSGKRGPPRKLHFPVRVQDQHAVNAPNERAGALRLHHFGRERVAPGIGSLGNSRAGGCSKVQRKSDGAAVEKKQPREIHTVQCLGFVRSVW